MRPTLAALGAAAILAAAGLSHAMTSQEISEFSQGGPAERAALLGSWAAAGDTSLGAFLDRLEAAEVRTDNTGRLALVGPDGTARDMVTDSVTDVSSGTWEEVVVSNVLRSGMEGARALQSLTVSDPDLRLEAVKGLAEVDLDPAVLPALEKSVASETDTRIRPLLRSLAAKIALSDEDPLHRIEAARALGRSGDASANLKLLMDRLGSRDGEPALETDSVVRVEMAKVASSLRTETRFYETLGQLFTGLSLGSVLVLVALGLAITYGLLGVINMAHGELVMVGAYTTFLVQGLFRSHLPHLESWYIVAAIPAAFLAAAAVGAFLERMVLRHLYGRPLESLLATWGVSLILIQTVRSLFGPQNVEVASPSWLSGSLELQSNLVLPWNRLAIIAFAATVILATGLLLTRTRLGLFIRATTQNRSMARCVGVKTRRVDLLAFGFGSGLAGLAGVALSQIGNVGPDLGQGYIVDSFLVVVVGGVGQLSGSLWAGLALGMLSKLLEPMLGAVLSKIALLVLIILFIQKRPQGLFALKGRQAD